MRPPNANNGGQERPGPPPPPVNPNQQQGGGPGGVPFGELEALRNSVRGMEFPPTVHNQPSLAQQTAVYLRRMQNEMLRMMPQFNRSIQLIEEGSIQHLNQLIPVFQALSRASNGAVDTIQRLTQPPPPPPQQPPQPQPQPPQQQPPAQQLPSQSNEPLITEENLGRTNNNRVGPEPPGMRIGQPEPASPPPPRPNPNPQGPPNIMNVLSGAMQSGNLNLGNLMGQLQQQPTGMTQSATRRMEVNPQPNQPPRDNN